MRPGTTPHTVSTIKPFAGTSTSEAFGQSDVAFAGVSKDGSICWLVREAVLEVMDVRTSQCLSSWKFGEIICDPQAYITCVKEYHYGSNRKLLVGVCYSSPCGLLCILDIHLSKITRTIEIPQKISSLDPITNTGGDESPVWALSAHLRYFYGIVAVGTNGGIVYLIDMCLDDDMESDEIKPNKLQMLSPRSRDTEQRRVQSMSRSQNLCMVLDEEAQGHGYKYRKCDGTVMKTFNTDAIHVSCLQYIQQIGSLFVGFSFGCYQIWKLHVPVLEYSSRLDGEMVPITHVAYQEPENDPKNFSYIWVTRSTGDHQDDSLAGISLYQLAYNRKTLYSNYGAFYEDLTSVSLRFDLELVASPLNPSLKPCVSSRIITCYTLQDPCYKPPSKLNEEESFEESLHGPDLSLSVFVWECSDGSKQTSHMAIFDMNRWYHAQMPYTIRAASGPMDTCSYFSSLSLDEIAEQSEQGSVLAVYLSVDKLSRFTNTSLMPPEQHFYPSALAFNALCVVDEGVVKAHYLGTQRQVMATMQKVGPSILLNPKELYNLCIVVGLLPRPLDSAASNPTPVQMKESLLTMALNYHMLSFIIKCVQEWAPGEFVHVGCTLKFLLDWVWNRVAEIKNNIDNSCVTLYDFSGIPLDRRAVQTLYQSNQRLGSIEAIIKALITQSAPSTEEGIGDLQDKLSVVTFIQQHLQMVIWFYNMGLLPNKDEEEENDQQYKYPAGFLIQSYTQKRQEIQKLDSSIGLTDVLMIDGMGEQMGEKVRNLWYSEGGTGMYPPNTLHALLSIYLLDDISLMDKHSMVLYSLLDMVSLADPATHDKLASQVQKFSRKFGIPYTVVKQVQGFWLLDHKDFQESMSLILDPLVTMDFGRWQHQRIVKSLLYQGESKMAARYLATVQPSLSTPEEVKLKLTVLLASGLTAEALEYQRSCQDQTHAWDLLQHIFQACQKTKRVDQLLQLPMTSQEEETLVQFLTTSSDQYCQEILILHYLQRACYVEAIRLNEKLKQTVMIDASAKARERATARNAIVDGFMSVLTSVQRKLVWESYHCQRKPPSSRREVKRPQPLSTKVTKRNYNMQSRSSLYADVMNHVEEMETDEKMDTSDRTPERISRNAVFGTPLTPRVNETLKTTAVVYPEINTTAWQNTSLSLNASGLTPIRSKMRVQGASALKLLQTPKVERKTPRKSVRSLSSVPTPQSILKVCNLINSSSQLLSPDTSNKDLSTASPSQKLGFSGESMTVSPKPSKPTSPKVSLLVNSDSVHGTPKKLRFAMEDDEGSAELEPPILRRVSPVPSPKKLRFSDGGARESISTPRSPIKVKSALARSPVRPVKDRSPTPENISMSPKNRSKLDKVNRSPRTSISDEETTKNRVQGEDIEMEEDGSFHSPAVPYPSEISAIRSSPRDVEPAASKIGEVSPTIIMTNFPKGRFTQLKNSPHKASPKKLNIGSVCRSPTVKLSQERTALFSDIETVKTSEEEVSTTTEVKEPIEIDLTMDEDGEEDNVPDQSGEEVSMTVEQVKDRTLVSAADSSVDNIPTYAFAPPASTDDVPLVEKRAFQRLRSKHQFTFSPPVQVDSPGYKNGGTSFDFSKTAEADSTSEVRTDNNEVFSSMNGKLDVSPDDEVNMKKESKARRGNLRSQKFKFSLKSPPSEQKLLGRKPSKFSKKADGSFLNESTDGRTKKSPGEKDNKKDVSMSVSKRTRRTPSRKTAKKSDSEKEFSTEQEEMESEVSEDIPDSGTQPENEESESEDKEHKSRRGRSRKQNVSTAQTKEHKSSSRSPSTKYRKGSKSESSSVSPSQKTAKSRSRSRSKSQEKVVNKSKVTPSRHSTRKTSESFSQDTSSSVVVEKSVRQSARRGGSKSKSPVAEVPVTPTRHSSRLRGKKSLSPSQDSILETSVRSRRTRGKAANSSSRERSTSPKSKEEKKMKKEVSPTPRRGRRKQLNSESSEVEVHQTKTPSRRTKKKDQVQQDEVNKTTETEIDATGTRIVTTPSRQGRKKHIEADEQEKESETEIKEPPVTPSRHGRKKQTEADTEDKESEVESAKISTTPSRRGRRKQTNTDLEDKESEVDSAKISTTPSRRGRRKQTNTDLEDKESEVDSAKISTSPSRHGRRKQTDTDLEDKESEVDSAKISTSPSRRGRRKQTDTDISVQESEIDVVVTPSRHGTRIIVERQVTEVLVLTQTQITPSRRGRKKQALKELDGEEAEETKKEGSLKEEEEKTLSEPESQGIEGEERISNNEETDEDKMSEDENKNENAASLSFEFAMPVGVEIDEDSKKELEASFEAANSFIFSPPLTRGLSKRLSVEPDGRTSISSRLSLELDSRSRPSQIRLSQQAPETVPPILLPSDLVTPRPSIHEKISIPRRMSLRGSRSVTPEAQDKLAVPRRGASEPPDNPPVNKVRRRGRKKREESPVDDVSLIPEIPEEEEEPVQTRSLRSRRGFSEEPNTTQRNTRRGRKKAYRI